MPSNALGDGATGLDITFREVLEHLPGAAYVQRGDRGAVTTYITPQMEVLLGVPARVLIESSDAWTQRVHPDDHERLWAEDARADETGTYRCEYRLRDADGTYRWLRDEATRYDRPGEPPLWVGVLVDIHDLKTAEEDLRAMESRYRNLVEQLPAATYVDALDEDFTALYVSPQIEQLLGIDAEVFTTLDLWSEHVHPDDRASALRGTREGAASGAPFTLEYRMIRADGEVIWVRDQSAPIADGDGPPATVQGLYTDITDQKHRERELEEAVKRFQTLAEQIPAVTYIEPLGGPPKPSYVSPQYEQLFGYTPEERLMDPGLWERLIHPADRERVLAQVAALGEDEEGWSFEYRMLHRDGHVVWVRDHASKTYGDDGTPLFYLGVLFDITESKLAQDELTRALDELRRADEMKNTFLTAVSHDLRTPLATILGNAVTLEHADELGLSEEDRRTMARTLATKAQRLTALITDLLDMDRLTRGALEPRIAPEELAGVIERVVRDAEQLAGRRVELQLVPAVVMVDRSMVERIVENLLVNAVKHTPDDVTIRVRSAPVGDAVEIVVEDDGPGIPAELREALFRPFERGPSANAQSPGVGLGLSLVARFAELHGGRAWVEDAPSGGAAFHVLLASVGR